MCQDINRMDAQSPSASDEVECAAPSPILVTRPWSGTAFLKQAWNAVVAGTINSGPYRWFMRHILPCIRLSCSYTAIRGWQYQQGYAELRPGDILVATDRRKLASMLIPGEFAHAALCVAKNESFEVAEMTRHGFTKSMFFDICKEADRVVILRCRDWQAPYTARVIECCRGFENELYDVTFQIGNGGLYCASLVVMSDPERKLDVEYGRFAGTDQPCISPTAIYNASNVDVVWDSEETRGTRA